MVHDPDCLMTLDLGRAHAMWIMRGAVCYGGPAGRREKFLAYPRRFPDKPPEMRLNPF